MRDKVSAPCRDCKDRKEGCHGWCERYKAFVAENERIKAEKKKQKDHFRDYAIARARKHGR